LLIELLPFVITVSDDQATAFLECRPKSRLGGNRVGAGVDERSFFVLGPGRDQPPSEGDANLGTVLLAKGQDLLSRRDVETREEFGHVGHAEKIGILLSRLDA